VNDLLDTCVLSELVKPQPEPAVLAWMSTRTESELFVSAMTLAELHRGVRKLSESKRRTELTTWLQQLELGFEDRVLPFDQHAAHTWAQMTTQAERQGKPMAAIDSIIAATAIAHGLRLVTRNVRDFAHSGAQLLNPWPADTPPAP
jgi:predicted nucleic acid-binding protein